MSKGVRKGKHHTLILRFTSKQALADFVNEASHGRFCAYEADALDPEVEGIGRAPANTYVLRAPDCDTKPAFMKVK